MTDEHRKFLSIVCGQYLDVSPRRACRSRGSRDCVSVSVSRQGYDRHASRVIYALHNACLACARPMVWRKKWAKVWDEVKYCSDKCRKTAKG